MKRRVFAALFVAVLSTMIGLSIIEPLMAIYSESLGASGLYIGLIFAAYTISRGFFTPLAGKLSDHHGRRNFIAGGLLAYTAASFLYLFAHSVNSLIAVRILQGTATAFVAPLAMAYIGDISPKNEEGRYLGTFTTSLFLGLGIGPIIGGVLNHYHSMNAAFIAMGSLGAISFLTVFFMLPELGFHKRKKPTSLRKLLLDWKMQEILFVRFIASFGVSGFIVFFPLYATSIGLNTAQIGLLVTVNLMLTALLQRFFGNMADRHSKIALIVTGNFLSGLAIMLLPLIHNFYMLMGLNLIMGIAGAITTPANTALAAQFGRIHGMGSVMGLLNAAFSVGMAVGPIIAGLVFDIGGLTMVFLETAAIVIGGTAVFYFFIKRNNQRRNASISKAGAINS